ncbi:hypothetical protein A2368_01260 [Candidatus Collierbacteria bacterium RIFOXYB1_FULL_49_13]|uniref:26 kDa periplasmic immunogenic protein n=1 Tax=Candidatus Collierbacteria bacterium RIFOXYB1_FULL_49_13 TaxID=1817728 RepID=A0A1F5FJL2_9BACT|nr:MAG: hypothetical protein A2368_01260 [Candidatus Collierbacteria bacterium RIFOXYB1_FULL_49_13]
MMQYFRQAVPAVMVMLAFFAGVFGFTKLVGPLPLSVVSTVTNKTDVFSVSGQGKVTVTPDIAYVTVGIEASGVTVKEVQGKINEVINKLNTSLKGLGVAEKDLKTTNYRISPTYDWTSGRQRITGFQAGSNIQVKVREIDKVNEVIDTATANGANEVGGVTFDVDDKEKWENEAREKAVAEAKSKAEQAARIAGFRLGKIINYSENFGGGVVPMYYGRAEMAKLDSAMPAPATEVNPGSSEVVVMVSLSYQLE